MLNSTGCDAVMIGRGALGNPFIFREINHLLQTGHVLPPSSFNEKALALLKQAKLACAAKGEPLAMRQLRKHAPWYLKGAKNAARLREAAVRLVTLDDLLKLLKDAGAPIEGIMSETNEGPQSQG
jgi:tRNA-dihydrouridine synthase B